MYAYATATRSSLFTFMSQFMQGLVYLLHLQDDACSSERQSSPAILPDKLALTPAWLLKSEKLGLPAEHEIFQYHGHHTCVYVEHLPL